MSVEGTEAAGHPLVLWLLGTVASAGAALGSWGLSRTVDHASRIRVLEGGPKKEACALHDSRLAVLEEQRRADRILLEGIDKKLDRVLDQF